MYGDHHYANRDSRPLSFIPSNQPDTTLAPTAAPRVESPSFITSRNPLIRAMSNEKMGTQVNGQGTTMDPRTQSPDRPPGALSATPSFRDRSNSDTANSHFPLNDLDYESNPAAVAQELSNLQALRRMSMDVNAAGDPDLPSFNSNFGIPSAAPTGTSDEDDRARLFWVPARIHPELAPTEFKTFLDSKVNSIKRRSEDRSLSPDSPQHDGSGGGLRRKKSMLSRQIDNSGGKGAEGYTDGAERLDRKKSLSGAEARKTGITNLQELGVLVSDGERGLQRLSIDTTSSGMSAEGVDADDIPLLPAAPAANSLRRSTRTTYRRGSLRKGERVPFSKRAAKSGDTDTEESLISPATPAGDMLPLSRTYTDPLPSTERSTENFSRPGRPRRTMAAIPAEPPQETPTPPPAQSVEERPRTMPAPKHFVSQIASNGRSSLCPEVLPKIVPQIIETPPSMDDPRSLSKQSYLPERSSSHEPPPPPSSQRPMPYGPTTARGQKWPPPARQNPNDRVNQTLKDMAAHPSPLPGNSTRTDSLSFIPTLTEDRKPDTKKSHDKKEKDGGDSPRKSSWSWGSLLGSEEKEKERKREEDVKKTRSRLGKLPEKTHDNTRLDLLQTTMEGTRGRESLVLDRADLRLEEERKKESSRKSGGADGKKEKDPGLFSSLFGGKKKAERDSSGRKNMARNLSPEPPQRVLRPDIDYNWTRFSILEERAIYRMAHIKLANPRRALHSQVLLSNFMYSYLAKVQQMHPQIQLPAAVAQPKQTLPPQPKKAEPPEEFFHYQRYQEVSRANDLRRAEANSAQQQQKQQKQQQQQEEAQAREHAQQRDPAYADEASLEYDHSDRDRRDRPQSRTGQHDTYSLDSGGGHSHPDGGHSNFRHQQPRSPNPQQNSLYPYPPSQFDDPGRSADDDMW